LFEYSNALGKLLSQDFGGSVYSAKACAQHKGAAPCALYNFRRTLNGCRFKHCRIRRIRQVAPHIKQRVLLVVERRTQSERAHFGVAAFLCQPQSLAQKIEGAARVNVAEVSTTGVMGPKSVCCMPSATSIGAPHKAIRGTRCELLPSLGAAESPPNIHN
jgi:hypothetical protein